MIGLEAQLTPDSWQNGFQEFVTEGLQFDVAVILLEQRDLRQCAFREEEAKLPAEQWPIVLKQ
jgi:hypothetical protein